MGHFGLIGHAPKLNRGTGCAAKRADPVPARRLSPWIDESPVAVRSHALGMPVFPCPACQHDRYLVYELGGARVIDTT